MQRAYISKLMELAEGDKNVLHLVADSGTGFDEMFRRNFPGQMYNFGIAEEHMAGAAAGMATAGKIPFMFTAGAFLAYRAFEFIRDDICFQNLNVKIVGMGSGLSWSTLGPTHHTTEDTAILRSLPNLMLLSPATPRQTAACVEKGYAHQGPVYIRIGMNNEKEFFDESYTFSEKNEILFDEGDISIFVTGSILEEAMEAAGRLKARGIGVRIVNVCSLKPFDKQSVLELARRSRLFVTVEEHSIYGGLGSIISEIAAESGLRVRVARIGLKDMFAVGYGTQRSVRAENGLDAAGICHFIQEACL